jgi:hypothetical protein
MAGRFEGFFKEPVHESAAENFRVRKIRVLYYLEDDSMQISEPKEENSGIPQGVFIKRHRIPKPDSPSGVRPSPPPPVTAWVMGGPDWRDGRTLASSSSACVRVLMLTCPASPLNTPQFYTYNDLDVGLELTIYSRTFRLIDADPFTRVRACACRCACPCMQACMPRPVHASAAV